MCQISLSNFNFLSVLRVYSSNQILENSEKIFYSYNHQSERPVLPPVLYQYHPTQPHHFLSQIAPNECPGPEKTNARPPTSLPDTLRPFQFRPIFTNFEKCSIYAFIANFKKHVNLHCDTLTFCLFYAFIAPTKFWKILKKRGHNHETVRPPPV